MKKFIKHLKKEWFRYGLETIVVTVGILGAFTLDNWNENRKTEIVKKEYLKNIRLDLVADTVAMNGLILRGQSGLKNVNHYYDFYKNNEWTLSQIIDSSKAVITLYLRYFPKNQSYNDMMSIGNTKLLNEEIRRGLSNLKIDQDFLVIITDRIILDLKQESYEIKKYWDTDGLGNDFLDRLGEKAKKEDLIQGLRHTHNRFSIYMDIVRLVENRCSNIKNQSKNLIQQIDSELRN